MPEECWCQSLSGISIFLVPDAVSLPNWHMMAESLHGLASRARRMRQGSYFGSEHRPAGKLSLGATSPDSYLVIVRDRYERQAHDLGSSGVAVGHDRFRNDD